MARFIEIQEREKGTIKVLPKDFYEKYLSADERIYYMDYYRRVVMVKTTVINVDEIKKIEPIEFECATDKSPIYPKVYRIYLDENITLEVDADEYEKKLKNLLLEKNLETTL